MVVVLSGLVGALIGSVIAAMVQFWKFNRDELASRIDDLCRAAAEAARLSTDYWSKTFGSDSDRLIAEAAISGQQSLVDGLYADVRGFLERPTEVDQVMSRFVDMLTGEHFTESGRPADLFRVSHSYQVSSELIVALRRAHRGTMPLSKLLRNEAENRNRTMSMPHPWRG